MTEKDRLLSEYVCLWNSIKELNSTVIKLQSYQNEVFDKLMTTDLSLEEMLALSNSITSQAMGDITKELEKIKGRQK